MKKIIDYILSAMLIFFATGCSKFLDVNPKGEVFNNDMFTSAEGYEDALYGIYAELGSSDYLYKNYMLWLPEALSVNINTTDNGLQNMAVGNWYKDNAPFLRKGIWSAAYKTINHINNILNFIEKGGDDEFRYTKIYKGEALALRALLHFNMLGMYGPPVWADEALKAKAIPYAAKYSFDITPFSSFDKVYELIINDLKAAETCLKEDETLLAAHRDNISSGGFISCRTIHMNLYAVQAMLARVYWYRNDLQNAAAYAKKVIDSGKFKMREKSAFVQPDNGTLELDETIFGIFSTEFNSVNAKSYGLLATGGNFTLNEDWHRLYDDGSASTGSDYRLNAWFYSGALRKLVNNTFIEGSQSYNGKSILGVNVLRIPEMYYIVAESLMSSDPVEAAKYYDTVVTSRGLDALSGTANTLSEDMLFRERRKEFYGEGLLWLDMKRLGKDIKVSASITLSGSDPVTYTVPIPLSEEENRN